ncbi:lipoprotein-releasing ABC transporter permease subunit LolE [Thalassotalea sp. M1531]|uniref:Lipoprotein-releasing ABC transporter permease subunit LolE n=1 Tax=Thalassotalea algicola TaxID=2716224 RepID=A0A7Y0Q6N8_9GAMM|nr:lipoprotein-releasing ABC transporter permease subunit LolE [Thalassotalea algicola]NMP31037.1 lipoprotein-releasing ABC transporter permease subunit LolE [Thalassotalea algicola]
MFQPFSLFVGLRYIRSRRGKGFAKFISAASTIGIALGVMVLIVVLSAMNGFEKVLAEKLLSIVPHAELIAVNEPVKNWQQRAQKLTQHPQVISVAPVIKLTGMMQYKSALKAVEIRGVDAQLELAVSNINDYIIDGSWQQTFELTKEGEPAQLVIGAGIAKKLDVNVGDKIQVLVPQNSGTGGLEQKFKAPKRVNLTIGAIFKFGGMIDDSLAYIPLSLAAELQGYKENTVQGIRLKVADVFAANQIARELAYQFDHYVYIYDWTYTEGHLFNDIQLVRAVMFIVMVLVIAVASFNIVSTLIMMVNEKKGDIAILKTMGASQSQIMTVFIMQGMSNGIIGSVSGALIGAYIAKHLTEIFASIENAFNVQFLSGDVYFIDYLPTSVNSTDIYITTIVAFTMSVFATIYPAWQATKVEPAKVLGQI